MQKGSSRSSSHKSAHKGGKKDFNKGGSPRKSWNDKERPARREDSETRSQGTRPERPFKRAADRDDKRDEHDRPHFPKKRREDSEGRSEGTRPERPFKRTANRDDKRDERDRPHFSKNRREDSEGRSEDTRPERPFKRNAGRDDKFDKGDRPHFSKRRREDSEGHSEDTRPERPFKRTRPGEGFGKREGTHFKKRDEHDAKDNSASQPVKPFNRKKDAGETEDADKEKKKGFRNVLNSAFQPPAKKVNPEDEFRKPKVFEDKVFGTLDDVQPVKGFKGSFNNAAAPTKKRKATPEIKEYAEMPLNKYVAHSGECSRRDAAELVRQGKVKVNGELVLEPGYRVKEGDKVTMSGKKLTPQKGRVYILLNKPKGYITTNDDPQGRQTVMELLEGAEADRLFPVGRLDRNTSGLLLITNDGDLSQKLAHPSHEIKKVYQVTLDKPVTHADFEKIVGGVTLDDGPAKVDALAYLEKKNELGLEIHSGRNRIVRRIFESLGYEVEKLDRVMYAGLTKKNLPRGKWRYLDEKEVVLLKHFKS